MDFLRELVQNAMDAGTPRIEVSISHGDGVLECEVRDFGEGMDEAIIDGQLTRLFSSTKENDRLKIGKFGIGFTSIFAIEPDLVRVLTGRHSENWEVLFHPDRSFQKRRVEDVHSGTRILLYKRMPIAGAAPFVTEARDVLTYWCEHAETPIYFYDRTGESEAKTAKQAPDAQSADPFAAFASVEEEGERIDQPFALPDTLMSVVHSSNGIEVVIAYTATVHWAFFNGGLTLLRSEESEVLEQFSTRLRHVSFKVKSPRLEHTLTRDNVLRDEHYFEAMAEVVQAGALLRTKLLDRIKSVAPTDGDLSPWHKLLAAELDADVVGSWYDPRLLLVRDTAGQAIAPATALWWETNGPKALLAEQGTPLSEELARQGYMVVRDEGSTATLMARASGISTVEVLDARTSFAFPRLLDPPELEPREREVLEVAAEMMQTATQGRVTLRFGDFEGERLWDDDLLYVEAPDGGGLFRRPAQIATTTHYYRMIRGALWGRTFAVDRHHRRVDDLMELSEDSVIVAMALVQALLTLDRRFASAGLPRLSRAMSERLS